MSKVFIKRRGKHKFQFYRFVYKGGKTALVETVKVDGGKQYVMHRKLVNIPEEYYGKIEQYAKDNNFIEIRKKEKRV
jgi:hypothetical protein